MLTALHPPEWARAPGYAYGVKARGALVFISGQLGWDAQHCFLTDEYVGQVRQALINVTTVLAEAGAKPEHLVWLNWFVTDRKEYMDHSRAVGQIYRDIVGNYRVTMSAFQVVALMVDRAKVELEAIAVIPEA
jgi:enamine deaminase RidA (YjgF/YER057c/UK114 family)